MKKNNVLKHFSVIGAGTLINMLLGLITAPIITRIVDPVEYGQYSIFTMYSNIALLVLCLGLDQALVRFYYNNDSEDYKRALLFRCVKLPVLVSFTISGIIIVLSFVGILHWEFGTGITALLCLFTLLQIIYRFSQLIIRLEYKSKLYSWLNILQKASYIIVVLPLIWLINENYLLSMIVSTIISVAVCLIWSIAAQKTMWNVVRNDDSKCTIPPAELLRYAYPYIFSMGITTFFQAIDKLSLNYFCSYAEVGVYSSTMTLIHIFAIVQTTFNTLWAPMAVEHYTNNPDDKDFHFKGNQIITVIMFFIGLSLILVKDLFAVLLGEKYRAAALILPFLIFNPIMNTISETTVTGLVFKKKSKLQVVAAIGACVTNILGNTILVPKLGGQGAAISTGISYIVFFSIRTFLSGKFYYVDYRLKCFYFLTLITATYAMYNTFHTFSFISAVMYLACILALFLLYRDTIKWGFNYIRDAIK